MRISAVVPAAGIGKRFGAGVKKQFFTIFDRTILFYTLKALHRAYSFEEFILGGSPDDFPFMKQELKKADVSDFRLVAGGAERYETVYNCLKSVKTEYVLIHDAVRPFIRPETVEAVIEASERTGAAICALPVRDTLKRIKGAEAAETVNRDEYVLSHTPQVFRTELIIKALEAADARGAAVTDEAQAIELSGGTVDWVPSSADNIKITYLDDMGVAENLVRRYFSEDIREI